MPLPESLDVENALIFFHAYMYGPLRGKMRLYRARALHPRMAMSEDWEVFASILVRDQGKESMSGLDLEQYEVKSGQGASSYEYQYHRNSWKQKLDADRDAGHIFINHRDALEHVEIWHCDGEAFADYFDEWESKEPYSAGSAQRYRCRIRHSDVLARGILLMRIEKGEATYVHAD